MPYLRSKGLGVRGHVRKTDREKYLIDSEVKAILDAIEETRNRFNKNWRRDYAAIYLGYMFGLRIGEVILLERRHFDEIDHDIAKIPTLKQRARVKYHCNKCGKNARVMASRANQKWPCPRCGAKNVVRPPREAISTDVPEKEPPVIEEQVVEFVIDYIAHMRPDQQYLIESRPGKRASPSYLSRIFNTYLVAAGLTPKYSWHALRHGRASKLFNMFKNMIMVRDCLRQKSTQMAEFYSHLDPEEAQETRKILSKSGFQPTLAPKLRGHNG
jgi:integrase